MSWDSKFVNFGVVTISGKNVKVFSDKYSSITISVGKEISNVSWAGGELNVTLSDGTVRRYKDKYSYQTIR